MIESLTIENLRGVRSGKVDKLSAINVVVGPNNSGKSTLLEALVLLVAPSNGALGLQVLLRRGGEPLVAAEQIVGGGETAARVTGLVSQPTAGELSTSFEIVRARHPAVLEEARSEGFEEPMLQLNLCSRLQLPGGPPPGDYLLGYSLSDTGRVALPRVLQGPKVAFPSVRFLGLRDPQDLETDISRVGSADGLADLTRALSASLPGLTDLRIQKLGDKFVTHAYVKGKTPIPAYLLGDGAKRLIEIAAMVFAKAEETVLLEEPETFQHPRYMREIAKMIGTFAARGAQYVLTTHSIELIDALLDDVEARGDAAPSLAVHRTKLVDGELRVTSLDAATARRLRHDLLEDLRG